jgi:hypothetical protein
VTSGSQFSTLRTLIAAGSANCAGNRLDFELFLGSLLPAINGEKEMRFLAISLCALALLPAASNAQQPTQTAAKGPTVQAASVGFRANEVKVDASTKVTAAAIPRHQGQDVAFMVVGVGAMIVGALVHGTAGTIIVIGGAGVALYGLYNYLE